MLQDAVWYHEGAVIDSALTGIEQALRDITGKVIDVPMYELLGGPVRESVRVYKWIGADSRENLAEARHVLSELERFDPLFAEAFVSSTKHIVPGEIEDGRIPPPEEPGSGVSVSDELFEQRPAVPDPPPFVGDDFHVPEW